MEIYKDIQGYEGFYQISNLGNVKSLRRENEYIMKGGKTTKGNYITYSVNLRKKGIGRKFYIHQLVAKHFIKNPLNKKEVNHKDNNPHNNKASNLEWVTHDENMKHAMKSNRIVKGEKSGMSKLKDEDVVEIYKTKTDALELSKKFNVTRETIYSIRRGQTWKHITKNI